MSTVSRPVGFHAGTVLVSAMAALTTWVTLLAWTPFSEEPARSMVPLLLAVVLVAATGVVLRGLRVPAPLVALAQVVVLALWLLHRLGGATEIAGVVPTPDTVRAFLDALDEAVTASRAYSAPVPASVPEFHTLLIVAGSATAVLVDLLAVGLRRAPLAGLPLLAAYTAPVSILDGGVSAVKFAAAAICFLFLIAAGEERRLAGWGEPLTPRHRLLDGLAGGSSHQAVWVSARKIGFTATALAVVAPLLVPSLTGSFFAGGVGNGKGSSDGVRITNPMADLKRDLVQGADVDLLTERTTEPNPGYLRISVLNTFDGTEWKPSGRVIPSDQRADGALPDPPGLLPGVRSSTYRATIDVGRAFDSRWLPTPYPATYVSAKGDWRYDVSTLDVLAADDGETTAGLTYQVRSRVLAPTAAQLASAGPAPSSLAETATALPKDLPGSVRTLARAVTRGKETPFEEAVALQQFFRQDGGFTYSLERQSGSGTEALLRFLGNGPGSRVGYCEQFAASMALMGRTLGIPSRVAVGFLRPDRTGPDTYTYSSRDLHAWPEMYFGGVGWVRFEPTPASRTGAVPGYTTQAVPQAPATSASAAPSAAAPSKRPDAQDQQTTGPAASDVGTSSGSLRVVAVGASLVVLVLLALLPAAVRRWSRRRRWATAGTPSEWVEAGWREVADTATDLAVDWDRRATPRVIGKVWETSFGDPARRDDAVHRTSARGPASDPEAVASLRRLVALVERARYARVLPVGSTTPDAVKADVRAVVDALSAGAARRSRQRARWLPASVLTSLSAAGRRRPWRKVSAPVEQPAPKVTLREHERV